MNITLIIFLCIHVIGAISYIIYDLKKGNFEYVAHHGDGVRMGTPFSLVMDDIFLWEFCLFLDITDAIDEFVRKNKKGYEK